MIEITGRAVKRGGVHWPGQRQIGQQQVGGDDLAVPVILPDRSPVVSFGFDCICSSMLRFGSHGRKDNEGRLH
jgi:hypothetical protein